MNKEIIEVEAESLEEARERIESQIPDGAYLLSERVVCDGKPNTVKAIAETTEAALAKAQDEMPLDALVIRKTILVAPERTATIVEAFDEQSARTQVEGSIEHSTIIENLTLATSGKKGVFGIGKTPNLYRADIFHRAVVEIVFKANAKISATIGQPEPCPHCGQTLQPSVSGQMRSFLQTSSWPCPTCDVGAITTVISERGMLAERCPVLMTAQKNRSGGYKLSRGFGSMSSPDRAAQWFDVPDGEAILKLMKVTFDAVAAASGFFDRPNMLEAFLRKQW
jgi:hypothetical protein